MNKTVLQEVFINRTKLIVDKTNRKNIKIDKIITISDKKNP